MSKYLKLLNFEANYINFW